MKTVKKKSSKVKPKKQTKVLDKKIIVKTSKFKPLNDQEADTLIASQKPEKGIRKFKRLFFDIETSPNLLYSWRIGYRLNLDHNMIVKERAVMCICYKWEGSNKVHSLEWDKGDDKQMLSQFMDIINQADEVVGHNSDKFDIKWLRTRCLINKIKFKMAPKYVSVDTYKLAKKYFLLNSNKLDYIGQVTGVGKKMDHGGFGLWKVIMEDNDPKAMAKMVKYCKVDVIRLSQIYKEMESYIEPQTHMGMFLHGHKSNCSKCGSDKIAKQGVRVSAAGSKRQAYQCQACGGWGSFPIKLK